MSFFGGIPYDPYNDPPPPDSRYPGRQVVDAQVIEQWVSAADQREWKIFSEIEIVLQHMAKNGWTLRAKLIRRSLRHLRKEAVKMGFDWGKED
jgi:hypothetical protein